jgi:hypothetical protein
MEPVVIMIAICASIFGVFYLHYSTRNKERMALIEKGADASLFNMGKDAQKYSVAWSKFTLKIGMLFMGVAVGVLAGAFLNSAHIMPEGSDWVSMIFFFGGLSLVLFYVFDKKSK